MAATNPTTRRDGARLRRLVRRYHAVISTAVEGAALLLRLPLLVHVLVSVTTEGLIALVTGRGRSG